MCDTTYQKVRSSRLITGLVGIFPPSVLIPSSKQQQDNPSKQDRMGLEGQEGQRAKRGESRKQQTPLTWSKIQERASCKISTLLGSGCYLDKDPNYL